MRGDFYKQLNSDLDTARAEGLFKEERIITSAQQADITVADGSHVINFCANNYLGLANHPELIAAAKSGMDTHGFGMASVRFICGTQDSHKQLEQKLANFLGMEDAILYSSCFDANGGLFETAFGVTLGELVNDIGGGTLELVCCGWVLIPPPVWGFVWSSELLVLGVGIVGVKDVVGWVLVAPPPCPKGCC